MNTQHIKDHLALLKACIADIEALISTADTEIDVSSIAQPREATFLFDLIGPVTSTMLRMVLARLFQKDSIDATSIAVSPEDYRDLTEEMAGSLDPILYPVVTLKIGNELTGTLARVVTDPDLDPGRVVFGVLYGQ